MNWQQVCEHPDLKDLPFKMELNQQGQIVMTPVKVYHAIFQGKISGLLYFYLMAGQPLVECAIKTENGTKVADVAWASHERLKMIEVETECSIAPEICIEVLSESNNSLEMIEKKRLYLQAGAEEVWICDEQGRLQFYNTQGQLSHSIRVPQFPNKI